MNDIKSNLLDSKHWIRLAFMLIYLFLLSVLFFPILLVLVVLQFICALITGRDNDNLRKASEVFCEFLNQVIRYLTYSSDDKPWPFNDVSMDAIDQLGD